MCGAIANFYEASTLTVESVIQNCTRIIERSDTVAGAGRRMQNPLLSIFLGENAEKHIRPVQEAYYSCWSERAKNLIRLKGFYSREDIENAIVQATQLEGQFEDPTTVRMAWFWDIMDNGFDRHFSCVKQSYSMPIGVHEHRVFFIFCSQKDSINQEKTRLRLKEQLIPWAREMNVPLFILSDATRMGVLNERRILENYRLAASLLLIMNTHYMLDETDLGREMSFNFSRFGLWSGAYHGCSKNFEDIVGVSLLTIIKRYRQMGQKTKDDYRNTASTVQSRVCGPDKTYFDLLDDIFEKSIVPKFPEKPDLWNDVPYTQGMKDLEEYITYCNEHQDGGFFGRLFSRKPREVSPQEALSSLGDFWKCCLNLYYMDPARKWIESPAGAKELKNIMYSLMSTKLNYDEMQTLLSAESKAVLTLAENVKAQLPKLNLAGCNSMAKMLHAIAIYSVKCEISAQILQMLADTMKALSNNAGGFDELLEMVQNSLSEDRMERSVVVAYGSYVNELIDQNEEVLLQTIRPSKDENELLQQLEAVFAEFVERDVKRIFQKSLQGDLQFRVQQGSAVAAANAISDCFSYKMTEAVRLPTLLPPSGNLYLYCIMNDAMEDLGGNIADDAVGHRFIVTRSDRIERLFLFKVEESNIMFSNQPE